jgi:nucleotide-binding universal stress UspA family protein
MSEYRTFLVAYDFSIHARAALYAAVDLARRLGADLHLLHVIQTPTYAHLYGSAAMAPPVDMQQVREDALKSLRDVGEQLEDLPGKVEPHVVEHASIAHAICELAEELEADLVVMGTHGRTGLAHVFLGSAAERTLREAPCPVLTVQAPEEEEARAEEAASSS